MSWGVLSELVDIAEAKLSEGFHSNFSVSRKGGGEVVTSVDLAVDSAVTAFLLKAGYRAGQIISEENAGDPSDESSFWLVDPVDGTREFSRGIPEFSFSAAWVENGVVRMAVVSNPIMGIRVMGDREGGLRVEAKPGARDFLSGISGCCLVSRSELEGGLFTGFPFPIIQVGSIAFKLALVAAGFAPSVVSLRPKSSWDIAAGVGLVEMAGGAVHDFRRAPFLFPEKRGRFHEGLFALAAGGSDCGEFEALAGLFQKQTENRPG